VSTLQRGHENRGNKFQWRAATFPACAQAVEFPALKSRAVSGRAAKFRRFAFDRVEINHAGLAAFTGPKGKKCIANLSWEKLFEPTKKHVTVIKTISTHHCR
jgi:hypothetical protein